MKARTLLCMASILITSAPLYSDVVRSLVHRPHTELRKTPVVREALEILGFSPTSTGDLTLKHVQHHFFSKIGFLSEHAPQLLDYVKDDLIAAAMVLDHALDGKEAQVPEALFTQSPILPMEGFQEFIDYINKIKARMYNRVRTTKTDVNIASTLDILIGITDDIINKFLEKWDVHCKGMEKPRKESDWIKRAQHIATLLFDSELENALQEAQEHFSELEKRQQLSALTGQLQTIERLVYDLHQELYLAKHTPALRPLPLKEAIEQINNIMSSIANLKDRWGKTPVKPGGILTQQLLSDLHHNKLNDAFKILTFIQEVDNLVTVAVRVLFDALHERKNTPLAIYKRFLSQVIDRLTTSKLSINRRAQIKYLEAAAEVLDSVSVHPHTEQSPHEPLLSERDDDGGGATPI